MTTRTALSVLTVAALSLGACSDAMIAPSATVSYDLSDDVLAPTGLLTCDPLPYASTTETIGPQGGEIEVGPHKLRIPAGALDEDVLITAEAPSDTVNLVRFEPHGLQFAKPGRLTMSYENCEVDGLLDVPKEIAYVDDLLAILYKLDSSDDTEEEQVTARLDHFSGYAMSW